ncbi:NifX-associated nitrogen fixation protein [Beggiatoa leptomitoformis]|uniref:NifX-associated nitrogen fixation protein n=1 Tax=Beggiatoa leptomitoformis TaxID=288004 RepID=A0A2N9YB43_9GAMM|nr:NifX-associated nitrogen fixation protein [Beggiatoa leptomitoformis]ALG66938.1 NifX-associated nitrogen fixation protein [Beggiatoa leptomitoformis]AUI67696.1 NifX-associated nitrogen fixation protein [Beggiatoa leptomitoformis]
MSTGLALAIEDENPLLESDFCKEMVKQMRALDTYDMYEKWSPARILSPLVLTKERKAEIPVIGDPDDITMSRVKAYYNAIASLVEKDSNGLMAVPMINLSHEGFGRAIITTGKLVVVDKTLRDIHRFGFKTLEGMHEEATKIVAAAVERLNKYREVAEL